jgi:ABC-type glycerol-3-phosphate transport system substrate-binding protein
MVSDIIRGWTTERQMAAGAAPGPVPRRQVATDATRGGASRRRVLISGSQVAAGALLAACRMPFQGGAGGRPDDAGPVRAPTQPIAVSIWHSWDRVRTAPFEKVLSDFQARHPTIRPEHTVLTPGLEVLQKLQAAAAGGTPPDIFNPYRSDLPLLAEMGLPLALDTHVRRDRFDLTQFYDSEVGSSRYGGKLYLLPCIPHNVEGLVFYGRSLVRAAGLDFDRSPPATWTELEAGARALTKQGAEGLTQIGLPMSVTYRSLRAWLSTNDAPLLSTDGRKALLADQKAVDVVQWMVDFRKRVNGGREAQVAFAQRIGGGQGSPITTGFQAMALHNPGVWFNIKSVQPDFDMGLFLIPVKPGARLALPATFLSWGYGIAAGSRQPDAAWLLSKYIAADEAGAGWFFLEQNRPSPVKRFNDNPDYRQRLPQWDVVLRYMASAKADTVLPVDAEIVRTLNEATAAIDQEKVAPAQGLRTANEQVQRILDDYWARAGR